MIEIGFCSSVGSISKIDQPPPTNNLQWMIVPPSINGWSIDLIKIIIPPFDRRSLKSSTTSTFVKVKVN